MPATNEFGWVRTRLNPRERLACLSSALKGLRQLYIWRRDLDDTGDRIMDLGWHLQKYPLLERLDASYSDLDTFIRGYVWKIPDKRP